MKQQIHPSLFSFVPLSLSLSPCPRVGRTTSNEIKSKFHLKINTTTQDSWDKGEDIAEDTEGKQKDMYENEKRKVIKQQEQHNTTTLNMLTTSGFAMGELTFMSLNTQSLSARIHMCVCAPASSMFIVVVLVVVPTIMMMPFEKE